jgi:pimeloyl-ACP methyl ester carboxylesterase
VIAHVNGIQLGYDDVGAGIVILLLHGFPHNRTLWAPQTSALVDRARCVAPDLRGFGESSVAGPFTIDQYADDVAALVRLLRVGDERGRVVVCGLSMGGYISFALWRRHRDLVRALVLVDTRAGEDSEQSRTSRRSQIALVQERGAEALASTLVAAQLGKTTRSKQAGAVDTVYRLLASAPVGGVVGALEAMIARPDSTPTLATIDVPTLIVVGDEDAVTPVSDSRAMQAAIAGSQLQIVERAGHLTPFERPAAFNHVVSEFLSRVDLA